MEQGAFAHSTVVPEGQDVEHGLHRAIKNSGGATKLARALGISHQAVIKWRRLPAERVLDVERISKISRHDLRPDIYGATPPVYTTSNAALNDAATKLLTSPSQTLSVAAAIEGHRAAREALNAACPATDTLAIKQSGGDISDEAMAPAVAIWEAADEAEHDALDRLLALRPTDPTELAQVMRYLAGSHVLDDIYHGREGLQNLTEMAENIASADPFADPDKIPGFVPMPAHKPSCFMAIQSAIPLEARRLLGVAQSEFDRRVPAYATFEPSERAGHVARMRAEYRLDALGALAGGPDHGDAAFLALAPKLIPMLDRFDEIWPLQSPHYEAAQREARERGLDLGIPPATEIPAWIAYLEARRPADELSEQIDDLVLPHMDTPATTLEGLVLKARVAASFDQYEDDAKDDVIRLMNQRYGIPDQPSPAPAPSPDPQPIGRVPCPEDAHPDAYGLRVNEDGAGMHAPPGSTVVVEPVPPGAGNLAVAYMKKGGTPSIYHMGDSFEPGQLEYHPDSEVFPAIEMFDPVTGRQGYIDCRAFEKLYRVQGVYVPVEVAQAYGPAPADLPILDDTPDGCLEHIVRDATNYPVLRTNDVALVDIGKTALEHGALCLIAWEGSGDRCGILQTNYRKMGSAGPVWCVDPINRPRGPGMMEKRQKRGGLLYASDGPYTPELLQPKIIGTIIGIRRSGHRVATGGEA